MTIEGPSLWWLVALVVVVAISFATWLMLYIRRMGRRIADQTSEVVEEIDH